MKFQPTVNKKKEELGENIDQINWLNFISIPITWQMKERKKTKKTKPVRYIWCIHYLLDLEIFRNCFKKTSIGNVIHDFELYLN